jgi:SAM-dependent methyltransferase
MDSSHVESATVGNIPDYALYYDTQLSRPTPYTGRSHYFRIAKDRMDRTFRKIQPNVKDARVLDIGASPFYLLYRALKDSAKEAHGVYFANDTHPLKDMPAIYSDAGQIALSHANIEDEDLALPDDSIDILTACEILEHCDNFPFRLAKEMRRVLRPGGLLCLTVPNVCSIANVIKLLAHKNIYYKYRSDATGRHKHEYTLSQLKDFVRYLGMEVVDAGYFPSPTSDKFALRPVYQAIAATPVLKT